MIKLCDKMERITILEASPDKQYYLSVGQERGTGELAQWLKTLFLAEGPVWIPRTTWQLTTMCNPSLGGSNVSL